MKVHFRILVLSALFFAGVLLPMAHGQTLGEVLRAVQHRRQLQIDQQNVQSSLFDSAHGTTSDPSALTLINWGSVPSLPTDAQVNALAVGDQIKLLKQAWKEGYDYAGFDEQVGRITIENFPRAVGLLAGIVRQDKTISWPFLSDLATNSTDDSDGINYNDDPERFLSALPSSPISFSTDNPYSFPGYVQMSSDVSLSIGAYSTTFSLNDDGSDPQKYYVYGGTSFYMGNAKTSASPSFPGRFQIHASSNYSTNAVLGLTLPSGFTGDGTAQSFYHPGPQLLKDIPLSAGASLASVGDLNGPIPADSSGISFPGSWYTGNTDPDSDANYRYWPTIPGQNGQLFNPAEDYGAGQFWYSEQENYGYRGNIINFDASFAPNYDANGPEFAAAAAVVPEEAPVLQIVPDTARNRLTVRLANDPANDCELVWDFSGQYYEGYDPLPNTALSERRMLTVDGSGKWDAVYSGKPEDREPVLTWPGGFNDSYKRWDGFESYVDDWWKPVLTQLKTATYLLNVTQQSRYAYKIDFYRADQAGAKDATTGRYAFSGTPAESWTVENPVQDDEEIGDLRVTTSKAVYDFSLLAANIAQSTSHWTFTGKPLNSQTAFLSKDVVVSPGTGNANYVLTQIVDTTSLDGRALPKITTTYIDTYNRLLTNSIQEDSTDGTRTTAYTYATNTDQNGYQTIDHLSGITQTGGANPYTATFDANELMTDYTSGSTEIQLAYNGAAVTRMEKFNRSTVRVLTTNYADGLATATITASGVGDAVTATNQLYPGNDPMYPWGPKLVRSFDGTLTTYSYAASNGNLTVTQATGRESGGGSGTVAAGTRTITQINAAGKVFSTETDDVESGLKLDFATATAYQQGASSFPSEFDRPLGTKESFTYDGQGQILSQTDRLGIATTYTLDALGRTTQATRGALTWNIAYNPSGNPAGTLGRFITLSASGQSNRTRNEQNSPFGLSQILTIAGPENITVTRTESASTITTQTTDSTTGKTSNESVTKGTLATAISGNATEPWNVTYSFPGAGWKQTATHGSSSALTATTSFDALGRTTEEDSPSPSGSGAATTTYTYTGGRLSAAQDPTGTTQYAYQPDGSLGTVSRSGRNVTVTRAQANGSAIGWVWKDATGAILWQRNYLPATGVTQDLPWGESARMVTTTPTISGSMLSLGAAGPNLSGTASWQDGVPTAGALTSGATTAGWTATGNAFHEVTSQTVKPGNVAANAHTTNLDALGLPTSDSGLVNATYTNTFPSGGFTSQVNRNGHTLTSSSSAKGDDLGTTGYGVPDAPLSAPNYGSTITRTLSTGAGNAQFTYNLAGLIQQRQFPDSSAESFTYDGSGGLTGWTTPRASFSFAPNAFGQPTQIGSMGTLGYDLAGRINAVANAADANTQTYVEGQPDVETHTAGPLKGQSVDHDYDSLGRLEWVRLPGSKSVHYIYSGTGGALSGVTCAGGTTGTWSSFDLVTGQARNFTLGALSTVSAWDGLSRGTSQASTAGGTTVTYTHHYDADGHCDSATAPEGTWTYGFDTNTGWIHTASRPGQSFTYNFDEAGRSSGHATDFRPTARLNNSLVTIFGTVDKAATLNVQGATLPTSGSAVAVNSTTGVFSLSLAAVPAGWQTFTTRATLAGAGVNGTNAVADAVRQVFVPPATETLGYDASGNRSADARWTQTWNALDQMSVMAEANPASTATATRLDLFYDLQGRRVEKQVSVGGAVTKVTTTLWDGWKPAMQIDYTGGGVEVARRYYSWGPDVSGDFSGAAGIGGLLEILEVKGSASTRSLPIYDGVGNVVGLVDATSGARVATYQYGPFGETLGIFGDRAASCPFRFQTRLYDDETGLSYFGKRYYDSKTQTWLSRDPMREDGGINLYAYCGNDPVGNHDPVGLLETLSMNQRDADSLRTFLPFYYGGSFGTNQVLLYNAPSGRTVEEDVRFARAMSEASFNAVVMGLAGIQRFGGGALKVAGGVAGMAGSGFTEVGSDGLASPLALPALAGSAALTASGVRQIFVGDSVSLSGQFIKMGADPQAAQQFEFLTDASMVFAPASKFAAVSTTLARPAQEGSTALTVGTRLKVRIRSADFTPQELDLIKARYTIANQRIAAGSEQAVIGNQIKYNLRANQRYVRDVLKLYPPDTNLRKVAIPKGFNVDEFVSRQFGGRQIPENQNLLPVRINKALGPLEQNPAALLPDGTLVQGIDLEIY